MSSANVTYQCIDVCGCARACEYMSCDEIYDAALKYYGTLVRATEEVFYCTGCPSEAQCTKADYFSGDCHASITDTNGSVGLQKCTNSGDKTVLTATLLFLVSCMVVGTVWFVRQQRSAYSAAPAGIVPTPVSYADDQKELAGDAAGDATGDATKDDAEHASV
jgi:hypothetical protein